LLLSSSQLNESKLDAVARWEAGTIARALPVKWISSAPLRAILFRHHAADNWQTVLYYDRDFRERVPEGNILEFQKREYFDVFRKT
jgi:hypothetical protein